MKDRVWRHIDGWNKNVMSKAGKEVLIKALGQVIPSYVTSIFLLPKEVCYDIEIMLNKFW